MQKEVTIGKETVILDTEELYSGRANPEEGERKVRKAIGLPVTKQLVYYGNRRDPGSKVNVIHYRLVEMYDITYPWYTIEVTTESGQAVRIHSGYLKEMQDPRFVKNMEEQEATAGRMLSYEDREERRMRWDVINSGF